MNIGYVDRNTTVVLSEKHRRGHSLTIGPTGCGKSKLKELELKQETEPYCLIDPMGGLAEAMASYLKHIGRPFTYLVPGEFCLNPFAGIQDTSHRAARINRLMRASVRDRGEADFKDRPREERGLRTVFTALEVKGMTLDRALEVFDYDFDLEGLPYEVGKHLFRSRNPRYAHEWESTLSRLESLLSSTLVRSMFSNQIKAESIWEHVDKGIPLIVNLRTRGDLEETHADIVGGIIISLLLEGCELIRRRYRLIIDEAWRFLNMDLIHTLAKGRHGNLSLDLIVQDLSGLKDRHTDMRAKVLSQCDRVVSFQCKNPDDLELLGKYFATPNLGFAVLSRVMDRPNGQLFLEVEEPTVSRQRTHSGQQSITLSNTETEGEVEGETEVENWSRGKKKGKSNTLSVERSFSVSDGIGVGQKKSKKTGRARTHGINSGSGEGTTIGNEVSVQRRRDQGQSHSNTDSEGEEEGVSHDRRHNEGATIAFGHGEGEMEGEIETTGGAKGTIRQRNRSRARTVAEANGTGWAEAEGESRSRKLMALQQFREEWHRTGQLEMAVENQVWMMMHFMSLLGVAQCVQRIGNSRTFPMNVHRVRELFSPERKARLLNSLRRPVLTYEERKWTGVPETKPSSNSSQTRRRRSNGSKPESSPITRLQRDVQKSSRNGNGRKSTT